jgi:hypothetical protein
MKSTASKTSLPREFTVIVASRVPMPAMPTVPTSRGSQMSGQVSAGCVVVRKKK